MTKLREEIARKEGADEMLESTAIKGEDFEEEMYHALQSYAEKFGDVVEWMGKVKSAAGSKKGDFLYTFSNATGQFVIETKDTPAPVVGMKKYLDEAMKTRSVDFAMIVTKYPSQLDRQVGVLNLYDDNKLFTAKENLEVALRWVRLYLKHVHSSEDGEVNVKQVRDAITVINTEFKKFKTIKSKLTSMQTGVDGTVSAIEEILADVQSRIATVLESMEDAVK
jgi:hypothetical protein